MITKLRNWLLARLAEPSTWRGFCVFLTGMGVAIAPEYIEHIATIGLGLAGIIGVATKDKE